MQSIIKHRQAAGYNTGGIEAVLFVTSPDPDSIQPGTVLLTGTHVAQMFEPFQVYKDSCVVITIGVYLSLLQFMKQNWTNISAAMDKRINIFKLINNQESTRKNISFDSSGTVVYKRWFDVCFFLYQKHSHPIDDYKPFIHVQVQNKSVLLDPDVLFQMSQQFDIILDKLTLAGYKYQGPVTFLHQ
jgi:hypothetical protein